MAKTSPNNITSLDQDWGRDPLNGLPFSGAAVQSFIKDYLGAIAKASYFDSTINTLYWFASDDDKQAFIQDQTLTNLILFSTTMSFASELFRIALTNNTGSTNLNVATNQTEVILNIDFDVQTKSMTESAWRSTGKGVYISVQVDAGAYGEWETLMQPTFYAAETNFSMNVRDDIIVGQNRVKVNFVAEDDNSIVASITYTIAMTEMFIEPMNNEWYIPIVETGDVANYKLGGFRIIGAVNKTLHIDIYNGDNKLLQFTKNLGTTAYDRVPYNYTQSEGLDLSSLTSGVYLVSAYLTSGTLTSAPVNYNIIYIAQGDETTAQFVAINDAADVVYNYTTSTLFKYTLYNKGTLTASPAVVVKQITGTTPTTIVDTTINDVSTGTEHTYEVALEWLTEETLNLYVQGEISFGNQQIVRASLDNSATFPPTYGYEFYLNAASRANSDINKLKIVNAVNHAELTPTWENMVWLDGIDGWTVDDTNRQCLYLPARTYMTLPYSQYKILNGENITVEMCYRIANVTDYNEIAIAIIDNLESLGFTGIRIKPTNITVHSSLDTSDVNDLIRGTNLIDEQVVHFVLTVYPNFSGNNGKNLVTGYINGCKNFQFEYNTGAIWNTNADLKIGCERSDISLYFIRVYRSVLNDAAVQANYINSLKDIAARTDLSILLKSCMDASQSFIDFENVKNNDYNFFVIEMLNGATLPSRRNGWDKTQKGVSNLEMHFGKHPDWDWKIQNVETAGQGTTSMNYYLWNLRWRIDKSTNKQCPTQYLESRIIKQGSYQYNWTDTSNQKTIKFDGTQHPKLKRMTAKINFASSMQDHKIGATRAYTDLHDQVGLVNEAQDYAVENNLPKPTVAVYEYPAFGFQKVGDIYTFIGLFTIGPDKGDKPTFGFDVNDDIKSELISIEGTDHSRKMVMFNYPWNNDVQYLSSNECLNIVKGASDYDNGWEVGNCHDLSTDESTDQAAIQTILETEFEPAYNIAYENSTLILGIPLGEYGETASDTLDYINANIATFQSQLDENNRMTYANYQFWIEGEYILYYYDIKTNQYVANQNLVTQHGSPTGSTVAEQNEWFKTQRRAAFMAHAEDYWDIQDTLFHMAFVIIFGAMDNFGKNTYPYKMATLANGGRWKWRQDDLDSILGIGNAGADNMPDWMEFQDSVNGSVYFGGSTSVFWNLMYECYYDDYISTVTHATTGGFLTMGKAIMEAMSSLAGGTNTYDGVMKFMKRYFWDNAQNYFPQSAYNADAALKYEATWLANGQEVPPLTQSLGNHYEAEKYWVNLRMIYMMSLFKAGAFGSYADTSLGQIAFRPQSLQSLTVTPYTELYPAFASGQGMVSTARTEAGQPHTFTGPFGTDGQTSHYINAANMLTDLGDLKDLQLGAQYINNLQIQGKKLMKFKIGDEDAYTDTIITPAVYYTQEECDAYNTEHELVEGDDGYLTTSDIKTPAVYASNVTTNVPSLSFDNTYCLEEVDARNAESLTQTVDLSVCRRLKKAYFEGTSLSQVRLQSGSKIEQLRLSDSTTIIQLRNLKKLTDQSLVLPSDLSNITQLQVLNCDLDTLGMLYDIYNTEDNSLGYFNIAMAEPKEVGMDYLAMLVNIKQNLDKDGNVVENGYHGISADGQTLDTANPTIDGIFLLTSGFYQQDMETLALTNIEPYPLDTDLNIGLIPHFSALYAVFDPDRMYIKFVDPVVQQICVDNWGDEIGVTMPQAAAVTSLATKFKGNTSIEYFNELKYFTSLTLNNFKDEFSGCTSLKSVTIPNQLHGSNQHLFNGCSSLEEVHFMGYFTTVANYTFGSTPNLHKIYFETLDDLFQSDFYNNIYNYAPFSVSGSGHIYVGGQELTNIVVPDSVTSINKALFMNCKYIESVSFNEILSSIGLGAFYGCSGLTGNLVIPDSVTSIGNYAFNGCTSLTEISGLEHVTSIGDYCFGNCSSLVNLFIPISVTTGKIFVDGNTTNPCGAGTGVLTINGNFTYSSSVARILFKQVIVNGNFSSGYQGLVIGTNHSFRVQGTISYTYTQSNLNGMINSVNPFIEGMSNVSVSHHLFGTGGSQSTAAILHFGYNSVVSATPTQASISKIARVYVGDGSSRANDEAVLALYLADTDWSAYSTKLGTWYDYNGEYKWYYITDNLTNCTNTNPDEWPHITRADEYRTTIVANEGYTLQSVKVEMYMSRDGAPTADEPTDITSAVYDASTGEIYINSVMGNIIITASAS